MLITGSDYGAIPDAITIFENRLENLAPRRAQKDPTLDPRPSRATLLPRNRTRDDPMLPYCLPFQQCLQQQAMRAIVKKMWDA